MDPTTRRNIQPPSTPAPSPPTKKGVQKDPKTDAIAQKNLSSTNAEATSAGKTIKATQNPQTNTSIQKVQSRNMPPPNKELPKLPTDKLVAQYNRLKTVLSGLEKQKSKAEEKGNTQQVKNLESRISDTNKQLESLKPKPPPRKTEAKAPPVQETPVRPRRKDEPPARKPPSPPDKI